MSKFKNMSSQHESNLFAILIITALALGSCNSFKLEDIRMGQNSHKVCRTKQCRETASVLRSTMDESVDPCDNFYKFACGRYPQTFPLAQGKIGRSYEMDWQDQINNEINGIITKPINPNDPTAINRARTYYKMCMDLGELETLGYQPIIEILGIVNVPIIPVFPKDADIDFTTIAAKVSKFGLINFMLFVQVNGDSSNQSINTVFVGKASTSSNSPGNLEFSNGKIDNFAFLEDDNENPDNNFSSTTSEHNSNVAYSLVDNKQDLKYPKGLPDSKRSPKMTNDTPEGQGTAPEGQGTAPEGQGTAPEGKDTPPKPDDSDGEKKEEPNSKRDKMKSALSNYVKKLINLLKPFATDKSDVNLEDSQLDEDINNLLQFLINRDEIRFGPCDDKWTAKKMTLKDLHNKTYMRSEEKIAFEWKKYLDIIFDDIFGQSHQFDEDDEIIVYAWSYVKKVLKLYSVTDPRILVMAIWFDHMSSITLMTTNEMRRLYDEFKSEAFNKPPVDRAYFCMTMTCDNFTFALNFKFLKDPMATFKKFKVDYMTELIKTVFKNALIKADWIDPFSKKTALEKLKVMRKFIGFPPFATNINILNMIYTQEELKNFVVSTVRPKTQGKLQNLSQLFFHNDESSRGFRMGSHTVNACYAPSDNSLTIPWAIMHLPYYGFGLDSLDLGAIGRVVGHEITHGYDNNGRNYNHDGNNSVWMTIPSKKSFREGAKCFIQSYSSIRIEEIGENVNGELTLNENIADNGGISLAYTAFQILKKRSPPQLLAGYERYTPAQLFTIGVALPFCGNYEGEYLRREIKDVHPPGQARVNGMMMNFSEFPKIWKCKSNAPMNPSQKCKLW